MEALALSGDKLLLQPFSRAAEIRIVSMTGVDLKDLPNPQPPMIPRAKMMGLGGSQELLLGNSPVN
jgi:hypothetical protein